MAKWAVFDVPEASWLGDESGVWAFRDAEDARWAAVRAEVTFGYARGGCEVRRVVVRWVKREGLWWRAVREVEWVQ